MSVSFNRISIIPLLLLLFAANGCIKPFFPPSAQGDGSMLVVDGTITVGKPVQIKLSRTKDLIDTIETKPEPGAQLQLETESGISYPFVATQNGVYEAQGVNNPEKYRLRIRTQNGDEFLSDFVETRISPAIDSVQWVEDEDVYIYVNTHDPTAQTRNYRWEFEETIEYHAVYDSNIDFINGQVVFIGPEAYRFACFKYFPSEAILINTSGALGDDVISNFLLQKIPNDNSKISFRYSMLVKQYAITPEAYEYWRIVKQNSEQTGNIFDPQPSQLYGNIHNIKRPEEPVIGYLSASTVSEKRIFIRQSQLDEIRYPDQMLCKAIFPDPSDIIQSLQSGEFLPAYYTNGALAIAPKECVDCRLAGGTTPKPSYW